MMAPYYAVSGVSRQSFHRWLQPTAFQEEQSSPQLVLQMAISVRKDFLPGAGARQLYAFIRKKHEKYNLLLKNWGKHRFEALCLSNGLRVEFKRFVPKTTVKGDYCFSNLIEGKNIDNINQLWVSDICYIWGTSGKVIGYATTLLDVYSRRILGLSFSQNMKATQTILPALKQTLEIRTNATYEHLIFHSDGGKQYIKKEFLNTLNSKKITSSMAKSCYENAHAESLNDTIKNHMLRDLNLNSFAQLKKKEGFIKYCYNEYKPHSSLGQKTPIEFENHLLTLQPCQRTILIINSGTSV